jgi:hypothetical protein
LGIKGRHHGLAPWCGPPQTYSDSIKWILTNKLNVCRQRPRSEEGSRTMTHETSLGDSLYAWFDGSQIWLRACRGGRDHKVALEPSTYRALMSFAVRYWPLDVPKADEFETMSRKLTQFLIEHFQNEDAQGRV